MKWLSVKEKNKRGCVYCLHVKRLEHNDGTLGTACPYNECPYHGLDDYKTYTEYLKERYKDERRLL